MLHTVARLEKEKKRKQKLEKGHEFWNTQPVPQKKGKDAQSKNEHDGTMTKLYLYFYPLTWLLFLMMFDELLKIIFSSIKLYIKKVMI